MVATNARLVAVTDCLHFKFYSMTSLFKSVTVATIGIRQNLKVLRSLLSRQRSELESTQLNKSLSNRLLEVFLRTWDLGFTAFGGPPVHFQIIYGRFVEGKGGDKWIDEQTVTTYQCSVMPIAN